MKTKPCCLQYFIAMEFSGVTHNAFFWLLLKDRLCTRNILRKNRVLPSYDCVLFQQQLEETLQHLFLTCPLAISCWGFLNLLYVFFF
jgi:hypothetical protein